MGAAQGCPRANASCLVVGRPRLGALPYKTARPCRLRPGPATKWLWVRGVLAWGPVTNPTARILASLPCALWGRHECALGGAPLAWLWGVRGWALSGARPPVLGACGRGLLPTGVWCRGCRRGDQSPNLQRARSCELALRAVGAPRGRRRGGRILPGCGASGVGRSSTPDGPSLGHAAGARYRLAVGAGRVGVVTRHQPHSARFCELALRAVQAAQGRPGGGASCLGVGRPGLGALRRPTARPWGMRRGPLPPDCGCGGSWAFGPVINPTAWGFGSWLYVLRGRHEGAQAGGGSCLGAGRPGLGALPPQSACPWGVGPRPATHGL